MILSSHSTKSTSRGVVEASGTNSLDQVLRCFAATVLTVVVYSIYHAA